jgi:hypothetical protein
MTQIHADNEFGVLLIPSACICVICGQFRIGLQLAELGIPAAKAGPPKELQKAG